MGMYKEHKNSGNPKRGTRFHCYILRFQNSGSPKRGIKFHWYILRFQNSVSLKRGIRFHCYILRFQDSGSPKRGTRFQNSGSPKRGTRFQNSGSPKRGTRIHCYILRLSIKYIKAFAYTVKWQGRAARICGIHTAVKTQTMKPVITARSLSHICIKESKHSSFSYGSTPYNQIVLHVNIA
jgi:hypothetical protein